MRPSSSRACAWHPPIIARDETTRRHRGSRARGRRRNVCRNGFWRNLQHDDITASCGEVNDPAAWLSGKGGAMPVAIFRAMIDDYSAEVRPKQKAA
jgi:hypothetical protein